MNFIKSISLAPLMLLSTGAIAMDVDEDFQHGETIHAHHCMKCHTDKVYTRDNRVVKSINALGKQVRMCKDNTGTPWFDEDTDAVIHFLNKKYYKF